MESWRNLFFSIVSICRLPH